MADYIEREAALATLFRDNDWVCNASASYRAIENIPAVDAVVVTRCEDCKHYVNHPNGLCYLHTEPKANERGYSGEAVCVEPDGFCNRGEPREG